MPPPGPSRAYCWRRAAACCSGRANPPLRPLRPPAAHGSQAAGTLGAARPLLPLRRWAPRPARNPGADSWVHQQDPRAQRAVVARSFGVDARGWSLEAPNRAPNLCRRVPPSVPKEYASSRSSTEAGCRRHHNTRLSAPTQPCGPARTQEPTGCFIGLQLFLSGIVLFKVGLDSPGGRGWAPAGVGAALRTQQAMQATKRGVRDLASEGSQATTDWRARVRGVCVPLLG
jgi:hypothetical protein